MSTIIESPAEAALVACEVCLKEVPVSEATIAEATDYFTYFCGLACYERWKHRGDAHEVAQGEAPPRLEEE